MNLPDYNAAATDAAALIAVMGVFGAMFLFAAVFGVEYHQLTPIRWQARLIALGGAFLILLGAPLALMLWQNLTIGDLWEAAFVWKNAETGPFGWAVFAVMMIVFATPALSLYAFVCTILQRHREQYFPRKIQAIRKDAAALHLR